ncbi:hypothetical protein PanWU01x14_130140, partial [Parasponia andersonii]
MGIIYAWKIDLIKLPPTITALVVFKQGTINQLAKLVAKWQAVAPNLKDDFYLPCFVGVGLPEASSIGMSATFKGLYLEPNTNALSPSRFSRV